MAQPKRRWSKARTGNRRSTWKLDKPAVSICKHCGEPVEPHKVCSSCGYYGGREVIAKKEAKEA
ncbi:MAG: 50S ribosomal protein L32 [Firmicutes bacterium]|nr:50S ribosomal protein L32 [Bacillota bacterium]